MAAKQCVLVAVCVTREPRSKERSTPGVGARSQGRRHSGKQRVCHGFLKVQFGARLPQAKIACVLRIFI